MSPSGFSGGLGGDATVFGVWGGNLYSIDVNGTYGVRPVINLKADITISGGDGTSLNPYVVQTD